MRRGFGFQLGTVDDAANLAALHTTVAEHLTNLHGRGAWSVKTSEKGVLYAMRTSRVFVARQGGEIVGTLRLATKKPWAIDTSYFTKCRTPLYPLAMAVLPTKQHQGLGRRCLKEVRRIAQECRLTRFALTHMTPRLGLGLAISTHVAVTRKGGERSIEMRA